MCNKAVTLIRQAHVIDNDLTITYDTMTVECGHP